MKRGEEAIPSGEAAAIAKVVAMSERLLNRDEKPVRRDQHPKHHGCVRAEFVVEPAEVPPNLRVGLFATKATYPALIRFSNGGQRDDSKPDAHGMAIKLLDVPGRKLLDDEADATTHDFVLVDNPYFFITDAIAYGRFSSAISKAKGKSRSLVRWSLFFLPAKPRELATVALLYFFPWKLGHLRKLVRFVSKRIANPLRTQYWSTTPYRLGEGQAVKYSAIPERVETAGRDLSPDASRDAMKAVLNGEGATFQFAVQLQTDPDAMPVEDPTVEWDEHKSPFVPVARIIIPAQDFDVESRRIFGENLSFTPWHARPEHRPLGGINRTRLTVYRQLSATRHDLNGVPRREPTSWDDEDRAHDQTVAHGGQTQDRTGGGQPMAKQPSITDVIRAEMADIETRRKHHDSKPNQIVPPADGVGNSDAELMELRVKMLEGHTTGLAISGGGIRSGTFAVGFLQGLANQRLLRRFDYLSTVSGGGYAGGWLAAWLKREGDVENVEKQLDFSRISQAEAQREYFSANASKRPVVDEEPEPLRHLRAYSSFMFPRPGLLSTDTWTVLTIWVRNAIINLLLFFPLAMAGVLLLRLVLTSYSFLNPNLIVEDRLRLIWATGFIVVGAIGASIALLLNSASVREFRRHGPPGPQPRRPLLQSRIMLGSTLVAAFGFTVGSRWFLTDLGTWLVNRGGRPPSDTWRGVLWGLVVDNLGLLQPPSFLFFMGTFAAFMVAGSTLISIATRTFAWRFFWAALTAGLSSGFLFVLVLGAIQKFAQADRPDLMATFAVPGALCVVLASLIVEVAVAGRAMKEGEREWWSSYGGGIGIVGLLWVIGMGTVIYLPAAILAGGATFRVAIASGWVGATTLGILTGRFVLPKLQAGGGGQTLARIASLAPPIFLIGLLGLLGLLASALLNSPGLVAPRSDDLTSFAYYLAGLRGSDGRLIVVLMVAFAYLAALGTLVIDVNLFSLNAMYANRLTRCYLGASRPMENWEARWQDHDRSINAGAPSLSPDRVDPKFPPTRNPNQITGFDPGDDFPLSSFRIGPKGKKEGEREYWGPHLLLNATIALVAGKDLAWRDRKGDSFTLSPLYCGAKSVGYARLGPDKESNANLTLGRAMSISGAAVDPNMRLYQSGSLTALLSLFNARLGYWMENPYKQNQKKQGWRADSPSLGSQLLTEFLGRTNGSGEYVHLADGANFDNMGVYELIRRRCRYIVALDSGDDLTASDANLAALIRLCRIDFGVRIQIDTGPTNPLGPNRLSRTHVAVGRIRYDDTDQGQIPGVLVYVRASMTGDEPPDLQNYAASDSKFPFQPTDLRQSFDEEQFECYRCLGDHIASEVFGPAVDQARPADSVPHVEYVPRLFSALQARWSDAPETQDADYITSTQAWIDLQRDLRTDPRLARFCRELYPELPPLPTAPPRLQGVLSALDHDRAEFLVVGQMLQIMENTRILLGLQGSGDIPMNRGWINVFRRWVNTSAFQRYWPILRTEYGADFVRFCQEELHLRAVESRVIAWDDAAQQPNSFQTKAIDLLEAEFRREWPDPTIPPTAAVPELADLLKRAEALGKEKQKATPAWLIVQDTQANGSLADPIVVGIILAARFEDIATAVPGRPTPVTPPGKPADPLPIEFFVWIRCGYRSSRLGAPCVREVLGKLLAPVLGVSPENLPTLLCRYPEVARPGVGGTPVEVWLNFLARFEFRREFPPKGTSWTSTLLQRPTKVVKK